MLMLALICLNIRASSIERLRRARVSVAITAEAFHGVIVARVHVDPGSSRPLHCYRAETRVTAPSPRPVSAGRLNPRTL